MCCVGIPATIIIVSSFFIKSQSPEIILTSTNISSIVLKCSQSTGITPKFNERVRLTLS